MELPAVADNRLTETELEKIPPFGVIVGVATVNANATLRINVVDFFRPPPVEVTVIG